MPTACAEVTIPRMRAEAGPAWHQPVLGAEVLRVLQPAPGDVIVDGTAGTGGHSLLIAPRVLPDGRLIAVDRDRESLQRAQSRLVEFAPCLTFVHGNFRDLPGLLADLGVPSVDGIVLDVGMSSVQVDDSQRGFSFTREGPLDMRMDRDQPLTAADVVNRWSADELEGCFARFGEERYARRIARHLVAQRQRTAFVTTTQLAQAVCGAVPAVARHGRLHPATRIFQALRIAVNDELGALEELLQALPLLLATGGRAVILSFHSLEDRLVKRAFAQAVQQQGWAALTKKPLRPSSAEVASNPRARSARLRAIKRGSGLGAEGSGQVPRALSPEP